MQDGFVDLRIGHEQQSESFWPSFTDIMTVIMLIFLLAMLSLLIKNMDLVAQLRASLAAERAATEQAQSTSDTNAKLNMRLHQLEEERAMLQLKLLNLNDENSRNIARLQQSVTAQQALQQALAKANEQKLQLQQQNSTLQTAQQTLQTQLQQREAALQQQQQALDTSNNQLAALQQRYDLQVEKYQHLNLEHNDLLVKYNKLIRPARSAVGKVVVLVRYSKHQGKLKAEIRGPNDPAYQTVSEAVLHRRLDALKAQYQRRLYVRIVFPDDSGLSYAEAWSITESLLNQYDYYYQQ